MEIIGYDILYGASMLVLLLLALLLAKLVNDLLTPYSVDRELVTHDNVALSVSFGGYLGAVVIIFIGAVVGPTRGWVQDLVAVGGYALVGILLLNLSRLINDKLIFYKFSNVKEIIEDRNAGTGAVQCGSYLASGMIIAGAIHGEGGGIHTLLAFYAAGQVMLILFAWIYNLITPFDVHEEIEKDNVAAGISFAGGMVALGVILMKACSGSFVGWVENFTTFGLQALTIIILLPIIRFLFDKLILSASRLNREIQEDRNIGSAFLEATAMIGFATTLSFLA